MHITDYLSKECVKVPLRAATKWEAIGELVDVLAQKYKIGSLEAVLTMLHRREGVDTTYLAEFMALPHVDSVSGCEGTRIAAGKSVQPIDWEREDKSPTPTDLIVLVISGGPKAELYIPMIRISQIMQSDRVRDEIRRASTSTELYECLVREYDAIEQLDALPKKGVKLGKKLE
jgi:mannitol/fructose-specific phosphotransferase system IIA component (Ntr-type)